MLQEFANQRFQRQLLLNPFIMSLSNFLFHLHNPDSFTFEVQYMGCHCFFPAAGRECYKWVIEVLGTQLRMGSDKNAHPSHQLLTHAKGCVTHSEDLPSQWPSVRWHSSNIPAATLPTRLFADCVSFVHPLHSMGSVESCMRHTRSKQGWGQPWGLQSLQETRQSNGGEEHRQRAGMCYQENVWFHQLKTALFQVIAIQDFVQETEEK